MIGLSLMAAQADARSHSLMSILTAALRRWRPPVGVLESVEGSTLTGWVWDPRTPETPASVELHINGRLACSVQAEIIRDDVRAAGFGSGRAGFRVQLPDLKTELEDITIKAFLKGTSRQLRLSPYRMTKRRGGGTHSAETAASTTSQPEPARAFRVPNVSDWTLSDPPLRALAFYLPQFHPIPENDKWWGKGFTEWTNVTRGVPQFEGHYQPHRPGELGFYDLRVPDVQIRQAELARQFGLSGFCFYFYWFSGKVLLERPIQQFAENDQITFPFCLCWANENWTRRWDGRDAETLISQSYSPDDDIAFIDYISKYFYNEKYIKIDSKPVLIIYRPELIPDAKATVDRWRGHCRKIGMGEIFVIGTHSFVKAHPGQYGIDASLEFPPNNSNIHPIDKSRFGCNSDFAGSIYDYGEFLEQTRRMVPTDFTIFRGVFPGWDNTARRKTSGTIFANSSPQSYLEYFENVARHVIDHTPMDDHRIVFINAWNEWAEGAHLEPDERHGYAYLEATRMALIRAGAANPAISRSRFSVKSGRPRLAVIIHAYYPEMLDDLIPLISGLDTEVEFFFTTSQDKLAEVEEKLTAINHVYTVLAVENKGRDVAPFLYLLNHIWNRKFQYILKLHTKRSAHRSDGEAWRNDIYKTLADPTQISAILNALDHSRDVGIVGAAGHVVPMTTYWGANRTRVLSLCRRMGVSDPDVRSATFVAGTMFIARLEALEPLMALSITTADFEEEAAQLDATLAHAIERAISYSAAAVGLTVRGARVCIDPLEILTAEPVSTYQFAAPTDEGHFD